MTTRADSATARSEAASVGVGVSSESATVDAEARSRTASSLARLRPASAQRSRRRVAGEVLGGQPAGEPGGAEQDDVVLALGHGGDSMSPRPRTARSGQR